MVPRIARRDPRAGQRDQGLVKAQADLGQVKLIRHCKRLAHQLRQIVYRITAHRRPFFHPRLNA